MFDFFKGKTNRQQQVAKILQEQKLYHQNFESFIDRWQIQDDKLDIQIRISESDDTVELEKLYYQLQKILSPLGLVEVNFNVSVVPNQPTNRVSKINNQQVQIHNADKSKHSKSSSVETGDLKNLDKVKKQSDLTAHPRIKHILVVASGKGGVGKSTTTVNLAIALQKLGKKVGVLDADIYGPSVPAMLGIANKKPAVESGQFIPIDADGIAVLSIGNLLDNEQTPIAWRGIKATGALMQLYQQTDWPMLDYLLIDMPPGTGDIQLTLAQKIPVSAAIVITTPQHIALLDAQKGIEMFLKTQIPVLGVVENMAVHICSKCGHHEAIFGSGGADFLQEQYQVPLLGQLPLKIDIRQQMDLGKPSDLCGDVSQYYTDIAKKIDGRIDGFIKKPTQRFF